MTVFGPAGGLNDLDPTTRVRYSLGMIVGDDELRQDQRYFSARDDRHQRALHGWGVASGLDIGFGDDGHLEVRPGVAVDGTGRTVCVPVTQCADLAGWLADHRDEVTDLAAPVSVWVTLCYDECATDLVPVPSGPCRSLDDSVQPSRIRDRFRLELTLSEPPVRGDLQELPDVDLFPVLLDADADVDGKRTALSQFVTSRGDPEGFANRCLEPLQPDCVVLGRVDVPLVDSGGGLVPDGPPDPSWVHLEGRPLLLSTQFLTEWLLRVEGGGTVVVEPEAPETRPSPLDDLLDVHAPTAERGNVLLGQVAAAEVGTGVGSDAPGPGNARWVERPLELGLLRDVDLPGDIGPGHAGLVLKYDGQRWRPQPDQVGQPGPSTQEEPRVLSRPQRYAVVAGGVLLLQMGRGRPAQLASQGFLTQYGGLKAEMFASSSTAALLRLDFAGYQEAFRDHIDLQGRQFVVSLTPQSALGQVSAQVVSLLENGIFVFVGPVAVEERSFQELVGDLPRPESGAVALHIQVSAFEDERSDPQNRVLRAVPGLLEDA